MMRSLLMALLVNVFGVLTVFSQPESMKFLPVKGGTFIMGCTGQCGGPGTKAELPRHEVTVGDFEIAETVVTNAQYAYFLNDAGYGEEIPLYDDNGWNRKFFSTDAQIEWVGGKWQPKAGMDDYPMVCVSWFGALSFCEFYGLRLPFEAEWEFAARGGTQNDIYAGGSDIEEVGWSRENSDGAIHPVARLKANAYGLYDMSGNVWEWCYDWFDENYYDLMIKDNPQGPSSGDGKVNRGGCYDYPELSSRVSQRNYDMARSTDYRTGFRPAR